MSIAMEDMGMAMDMATGTDTAMDTVPIPIHMAQGYYDDEDSPPPSLYKKIKKWFI